MRIAALLLLVCAACGKSATSKQRDAGVSAEAAAPPASATTPRRTWEWPHTLARSTVAVLDDGRVVIAGEPEAGLEVGGKTFDKHQISVLAVILDASGEAVAAYAIEARDEELPDPRLVGLEVHGRTIYVATGTSANDAATIHVLDADAGPTRKFTTSAEVGVGAHGFPWTFTALPDGDLLLVGRGETTPESVITRLAPDGKARWPTFRVAEYITMVAPIGDELLVGILEDDSTSVGVLAKDGVVERRCTFSDLRKPAPEAVVADGAGLVFLGQGELRSVGDERPYAIRCDGTGRSDLFGSRSAMVGGFGDAAIVGGEVVAVYWVWPLRDDPSSAGGVYVVRAPDSPNAQVTALHEYRIVDHQREPILGDPISVGDAIVLSDGDVVVTGSCGDDTNCAVRYDLPGR